MKVCKRQFSCTKAASQCRAIAVDVGWGGAGVDEHIGTFQYVVA